VEQQTIAGQGATKVVIAMNYVIYHVSTTAASNAAR
jgi:hypothetical protein